MANNRDASKQRRARQNRAQREALKARTAAASTPVSERRPQAPSRSAPAADAKKKGGFFAPRDPQQQRPPRPGDVPVDIDALEGNFFTKRLAVPGGKQALFAAVINVVVVVMMLFTKVPPPDEPDAKATLTVFEAYKAWALPLLLVPLAVAVVATVFTLSPQRRRIWIACVFVMGFGVLILPTFMFAAGFLGYAVYRSSKIEGPSRRGRAPGDDDVDHAEEAVEAEDDVAEASDGVDDAGKEPATSGRRRRSSARRGPVDDAIEPGDGPGSSA